MRGLQTASAAEFQVSQPNRGDRGPLRLVTTIDISPGQTRRIEVRNGEDLEVRYNSHPKSTLLATELG